MTPHENAQQPLKSVRVDTARVEAILDKMDRAAAQGSGKHKRAHARHQYRVAGAVVHLRQPGSDRFMPHLVTTRNISCGGFSFLFGGFVHTGTRCQAELLSPDGVRHHVSGTVVSCRYVEGNVHEVCVRFDSEIDPTVFCPQAARSRVLLVDGDASSARLARVHLGKLNTEVDEAAGAEEAIEKALQRPYNLILVDIDVPTTAGLTIAQTLRDKGYTGAIVAVTSMDPQGQRAACIAAGCTDLLARPYTREPLAALLEAEKSEPLFSSLGGESEMVPIVEAFVAELGDKMRAIEAAFAAEDTAQLHLLLGALRCNASGYGFAPIAEAASKLETAIRDGKALAEASTNLARLARLCSRASRAQTKMSG